MAFERRINEILHEEHMATLDLLAALERLLAGGKDLPPDTSAAATRSTLEQLATAIEHEVREHFFFEEEHLITRMAANGEDALGQELIDEHKVILPIGLQLSALAKNAIKEGFSGDDWPEFFSVAGEFVSRLQPHVDKEEMAMLPILEDIIDRETDFELCELYTNSN
jgi:hemerythrin-like domain-containing protein